jgi:hypothetical protein
MENFIAERRLIAESTLDGKRKDVTIRIGIPYWIEEGEIAGCAVRYDGLFPVFNDRKGTDLLQALQIASDIDIVLAAMSDEFKFYWPSGELYELDTARAVLRNA